jgi:putative transposase
MIWFVFGRIFSTIISLVRLSRFSENDKDLEILVLRHQLDVMVRKQTHPVRPNRAEKTILAVLAVQLKHATKRTIGQLGEVIRIVRPETVIRCHRELVRRKWTCQPKNRGGRPKIKQELEKLIVRLASENLRWGYARIEGELLKLGVDVSITTVRNILDRNGILPAPVRFGSIGWRTLMRHYKDPLLACDFFTVETIFLRTVYVLVFIELGTRRVHLAGITTNPDGRWVAQQARQLVWVFEETDSSFRCLIRDNDKKYTAAFDTVFESSQIHIIPTPIQAPNANAYMERWVRTVREECLDHILIINETHLRRVLIEFLDYYNARRPHQGLHQQSPIPRLASAVTGQISRCKILGGIINDYSRTSDKQTVYLA